MSSDAFSRRSGGTDARPTILLTKGLEFDAVIVANARKDNFNESEFDRLLFYLACTRARHQLEIHWHGTRSAIVPDVARPVRKASQGARPPGGGGHRTRIEMARDYQCDSDGPVGRPVGRSHAVVPLTFILVYRHCTVAAERFIMDGRCVVGTV